MVQGGGVSPASAEFRVFRSDLGGLEVKQKHQPFHPSRSTFRLDIKLGDVILKGLSSNCLRHVSNTVSVLPNLSLYIVECMWELNKAQPEVLLLQRSLTYSSETHRQDLICIL